MGKRLALLVCSVLFCLGLAACGGGSGNDAKNFIGTWDMTEMTMGGERMTAEDLADLGALAGMDVSVTLELAEDGKATLSIMGESMEGTWKATSASEMTMSLDGSADGTATLADGILSLEQDGDKISFMRGSSAAPAASAAEADSSDAAAASNANDYGWVAFEMPQGWEDSFADFSKVEIKQTDGKGVEMKVAPQSTTTAGGDAEAAAAKRADQSDNNTLGEPFEQGGRAWYPVYFTLDGVDSAYLYTNISDRHVAYISAFKVTEADDAVKTVMNTITFNEDEII